MSRDPREGLVRMLRHHIQITLLGALLGAVIYRFVVGRET